ncbi:hypothetical protein K438DRAFT_1775309 [Mycena galopus ATCC 62051]|nr:hypothetical protein K438DRAFT_1775309 [Mycena galopus ATCC 62051]
MHLITAGPLNAEGVADLFPRARHIWVCSRAESTHKCHKCLILLADASSGEAKRTALFALSAAIILTIVRSDGGLEGSHKAITLFLVASYGAMLFNSIATVASLLFMDRLGDIEFNEARNPQRRTTEGFVERPSSSLRLLAQYGARKHVSRRIRHF